MSKHKLHNFALMPLLWLLVLGACDDGDLSQHGQESERPIIVAFEASLTQVEPGSLVELTWSVHNSTRVTIKANSVIVQTFSGEQASEGRLDVWPSHSVRYVLEASNALTQQDTVFVRRELEVEVTQMHPRPVLSLSLSPPSIHRGERAELNWSSQHAETLTFSANGEEMQLPARVGAAGRLQVEPDDDTTYVMTGLGPGGRESVEVSLTVYAPPKILAFNTTTTALVAGERAVLSWQTQDAEQIQLSDGMQLLPEVGVDTAMGTLEVYPTQDTTYTLSVLGDANLKEEASLFVEVYQPPEIQEFVAEPEATLQGAPTTLRWTVSKASAVSLFANDIPIETDGEASGGQQEVTIAEDTRFRLEATGPGGAASAELEVTVLPNVVVDVFSVSPERISLGESVTLVWETSGASQISLSQGGRDLGVPMELVDGSVELIPEGDAEYVLTARGPGGADTREVEVIVEEQPLRIVSFAVMPESVAYGEEVTLSWQTTGARAVSLYASPGGAIDLEGRSPSAGTLTLMPEQTSQYTLRALGVDDVVQEEVLVTVNAAVEIVSFVVEPNNIFAGEAVTLRWEVNNAVSVELRYLDQVEEVASSGSRVFTEIDATMQFMLVAEGVGGAVERNVLVEVEEPVPPSILSFSADPQVIPAGEMIELSWLISGATSVLIRQISSSGAQEVPVAVEDITSPSSGAAYGGYLQETTTFVLEARNGSGQQTTASVIVEVLPPLEIEVFEVTPEQGRSGEPCVLEWEVVGGVETSVFVEAGDERWELQLEEGSPLPSAGRYEFWPSSALRFTLQTTNGSQQLSAEASFELLPSALDPVIVAFAPDADVVPIDGYTSLRWEAVHANQLVLRVYDDLDQLLETVEIEEGEVNSGAYNVGPLDQPLFVELEASSSDAARNAIARAEVALQSGDSAGLLLSEVLYDGIGDDDGQEWIEIFNSGSESVSLWEVSLGYGGGSLTTFVNPLRGVVRPGECVVVGGPISAVTNMLPELDWAVNFTPDLGDAGFQGRRADGVALFAGRPEAVSSVSVPLDAVLYGGEINQGDFPEGTLDVGDATGGRSIVQDVLGGGWSILDIPTPGRCFGLNVGEPTAPVFREPQLTEGRRRGPEMGGNSIVLSGWGLESVETVWFGERQASCASGGSDGLYCEVPAGTGRVDLSLESQDGAIVYSEWYTYEPIDRCGLLSGVLAGVPGTLWDVHGWVFESEVTMSRPFDGSSIIGQWGYGPLNSDPAVTQALWDWSSAVAEGVCEESRCEGGYAFVARDQYAPMAGLYSHAFRFRILGEELWTYCDTNGTFNDDPARSNLFSVDDMGVLETNP